MPNSQITVQMADGTRYDILYTLRKKGALKNELVTDTQENIIDYLAKAHRQDKTTIRIDHQERPHG